MACYTAVSVKLDDNAVNRKAREKLGLPLEGLLSEQDAGRVRVEAGIIKARGSLLKLAPTAVVTRKANTLTITVNI